MIEPGDGSATGLPPDWWGTPWDVRPPQPLRSLICAGVLGSGAAAALARVVSSGESLIVASRASQVGKSMLLAGLIPYLAPNRERRVVRGRWDLGALRDIAAPNRATFLVNEISPHLPAYAWTPVLGPLLALAQSGAQLLTTVHADSLSELESVLLLKRALGGEGATSLGTVVFLGSSQRTPGGHGVVRSIERFVWSREVAGAAGGADFPLPQQSQD